VIKAASTSPSLPGDNVEYTFTLVNNGNVTINSVVVTDAKCAAATVLDSETITPDTVLEFGETQIWSCTSLPVTAEEVDAGVVNNTVEVTGDPAGGELPPATDDHDIPVTPLPGWVVAKTALNGATAAGDTIDYEFAVINTGNVSITDIVLTDAKCATPIVLVSESRLENGRSCMRPPATTSPLESSSAITGSDPTPSACFPKVGLQRRSKIMQRAQSPARVMGSNGGSHATRTTRSAPTGTTANAYRSLKTLASRSCALAKHQPSTAKPCAPSTTQLPTAWPEELVRR